MFWYDQLYGMIFLVIVVIVVSSFVDIVRPEPIVAYNYNAFPNVHPSNLPDGSSASSNDCRQTLTPCDEEGKCSHCGEADFKCTAVEDDGYYQFNNTSVPPGTWCLPKLNREQTCNKNTGTWVWTTDPSCSSGKQCWQCECQYPTLFTESEEGCAFQKACAVTLNGKTEMGTLKDKNGTVWDPGAEHDLPNPLSFDPHTGAPLYTCDCPKGSLVLPNDPYTCHRDKCWDLLGPDVGVVKGVATCKGETCSCNCETGGGVTLPNPSEKAGSCQLKKNLCLNGHYTGAGTMNKKTKDQFAQYEKLIKMFEKSAPAMAAYYKNLLKTLEDAATAHCDCNNYIHKFCYSDYVKKSSKHNEPCADMSNYIGEECVNPCNDNPCGEGQCNIESNKSEFPKGYSCDCSKIKNKRRCDCYHDEDECKDSDKKQLVFGGDTCKGTTNTQCSDCNKGPFWPDGSAIKEYYVDGISPTPRTDCQVAHDYKSCLSQNTDIKIEGNWQYEVCDKKHKHGGCAVM